VRGTAARDDASRPAARPGRDAEAHEREGAEVR